MKRKKLTPAERLKLKIEQGQAPRTVYTDLIIYGHDEDFQPVPASASTDAVAGSAEKSEVMRRRAELGQDLWHPGDNRQVLINAQRPPKFAISVVSFITPLVDRRKSLDV